MKVSYKPVNNFFTKQCLYVKNVENIKVIKVKPVNNNFTKQCLYVKSVENIRR